jgi:hypothetical protein
MDKKKHAIKLDDYGKEILDAFENGQLTPVNNLATECQRIREYARATIRETILILHV